MFALQLISEFESWLDGLLDKKAQVRIAARLRQKRAQQILKNLEPEL